ncbi:MAG: phage holin family protein [Candidatus Krumholzibacteria bacterium]|nr:phage holin family protein [Candidatus Krumholzibacteria bacterium]
MHSFLLHWLILTAALALTAYLLPGVDVSSPGALLVAALVLGFLNAILRPVLVLLTLPLTVLTLGLFYLVLNAVLFALASVLVPGFSVASFGAAFVGAILMSLLSWLLGSLTGKSRRRR